MPYYEESLATSQHSLLLALHCESSYHLIILIFISDHDMSQSEVCHTGEQPDSNLPDPSSQVTGPIYAEITDEESNDPNYASVGVATGKYTYNITTNTSYDTVMLHNMNPNTCYGNI